VAKSEASVEELVSGQSFVDFVETAVLPARAANRPTVGSADN